MCESSVSDEYRIIYVHYMHRCCYKHRSSEFGTSNRINLIQKSPLQLIFIECEVLITINHEIASSSVTLSNAEARVSKHCNMTHGHRQTTGRRNAGIGERVYPGKLKVEMEIELE